MVDLSALEDSTRLLFTVPLKPIQGDRFQPTGFPNLGAATYQSAEGDKLLVESAQSMANRFEAVCWDSVGNKPIAVLDGISHVTVVRKGAFLTDSMLESHRISSPYILAGEDRSMFDALKKELGVLEGEPVNRSLLGAALLKCDICSLVHGVFLLGKQGKEDLAGGQLRVARALSAFIEASGTRIAASGGVKSDHVNPSGDTKNRFGNVPFSRDEFTAERIDCHINCDLAQLRGYGLGDTATKLLVLLCLFKIRKLLDGDLRLRTACDLMPKDGATIIATRPNDFCLPSLGELEAALPAAIQACADKMKHSQVTFDGELKKDKKDKETE